MKTRRLVFVISSSIVFTCSCTKLHEQVGGSLTTVQANNSAAELLLGAYASLTPTFASYLEIFALSDMTTDEAIVPTRGNNWDDNGQWRALHQHKWDAGNVVLRDCFKSLGGVVFAATDVLQYNPTRQQQAEARFLRAFAMYWLLDLFDQVPYREPGENIVQPAKVRKGLEALNYIISELDSVEADLQEGPVNKANKFAVKVLLMKCYLNKGVYTDRTTPPFPPAEMNKVIGLADEIIRSGRYSLSDNYFDNFSPVNGVMSRENIFTQLHDFGFAALCFAWQAPLYYEQGGFNGTTTLSDFYDKFESTDKRREAVYNNYPSAAPNPGNRVNVGFLIDQQYDLFTDAPLFEGTLPVIFTPDVRNILPGPNLTMPGIRPIKYAPDYWNFDVRGSPPTNDFVYFRFPDVLLMKAEAILRGGTPTNAGSYGRTALSLVNSLRTHHSRNATALSSITLDILYDERGRELWWENWRRQDMIRFGKFLKPFQAKEYPSNEKYLLFPIPYQQIAVNSPNLVQNPGY